MNKNVKAFYESDAPEMRIMPHSVDMELSVISCLIENIERHVCREAYARLQDPEVFWDPTLSFIYQTLQQMNTARESIDALTVMHKIRGLTLPSDVPPINNALIIGIITDHQHSRIHVQDYTLKLLELHAKRKAIMFARELQDMAYDIGSDAFEVSSFANRSGQHIIKGLSLGADRNVDHVIRDFIARKEAQAQQHEKPMFFNIPRLDEFIGGILYPSTELIVIGARPSHGKSYVAGHISKTLAEQGIPVGYISLEMDNEELIQRMIVQNMNGIASNQQLIRGMKITEEVMANLHRGIAPLSGKPLWMLDKPRLTLSELTATAERWITQHGVRLIFLDFIQRVRVPGIANRQQEVGYVTAELKAIARDFKTPIIALSSLNRNAERAGGSGQPSMADLRESGDVESDADIIIMQWLPEKYKHESIDNMPAKNMIKWEIEKFRNGRTGSTYAYVDMGIGRFSETLSGLTANDPLPSTGYNGFRSSRDFTEPIKDNWV